MRLLSAVKNMLLPAVPMAVTAVKAATLYLLLITIYPLLQTFDIKENIKLKTVPTVPKIIVTEKAVRILS